MSDAGFHVEQLRAAQLGVRQKTTQWTAGMRKKRSFEKRGCTDRRNSHFDLTKPGGRKVDRAMWDLVKGHVFDPANFFIRADDVCGAQSGNGADGRGECIGLEHHSEQQHSKVRVFIPTSCLAAPRVQD
jgi:hypothetical protein